MKILATFALLSAFCVIGCHNNKPAQTPANVAPAPAAPAPVQGPPP